MPQELRAQRVIPIQKVLLRYKHWLHTNSFFLFNSSILRSRIFSSSIKWIFRCSSKSRRCFSLISCTIKTGKKKNVKLGLLLDILANYFCKCGQIIEVAKILQTRNNQKHHLKGSCLFISSTCSWMLTVLYLDLKSVYFYNGLDLNLSHKQFLKILMAMKKPCNFSFYINVQVRLS